MGRLRTKIQLMQGGETTAARQRNAEACADEGVVGVRRDEVSYAAGGAYGGGDEHDVSAV